MVEIRHYTDRLVQVNGAYVSTKYNLDELFQLGKEVEKIDVPDGTKLIEIEAFAIMRRLSEKSIQKIEDTKVGSKVKLHDGGHVYHIRRVSQNFITE